jgi:hypothetical protein
MSHCSLHPVGLGHRATTSFYGSVDWENARQSEGQWIVPCGVELISSRKDRLVSYTLGKQWVMFSLDLPANPSRANKVWSQWITEGFSEEPGKPSAGYAYRCRVKGINEIRAEENAAHNAFLQQRDDAARSIPADAPIGRWLPLFEDPGGTPAVYRWGGEERIEVKAVSARVLELAPLLTSNDRTVKRQAVFALGTLFETPKELVGPLLVAGRLTIELIGEAKSQPEPPDDSDPDPGKTALEYFDMWSRAMHNAGRVEAPEFRNLLEEIQREAAGRKGRLWNVADKAREIEQSLPPSADAK